MQPIAEWLERLGMPEYTQTAMREKLLLQIAR
jgi:hypothetical protein